MIPYIEKFAQPGWWWFAIAIFLSFFFMVGFALMRPDFNRQEIPDWRPVLALADASLEKGELYDRAVSIAAGVVGGTLKATGITLLEVTTESRSATALHGLDDLEMGDRQPMVAAIRLAIGAKDIGQFNAASCCRLSRAAAHGLERG